MSLTRDFATELIALSAKGLDHEARQAATWLVLDGLAVAALGADQTGPRLLAEMVSEAQARSAATLIGHAAGASAADAARVNGAAMHVLDYEPMWNPANHAVSTTLPALLALAESGHGGEQTAADRDEPTGSRLLTALALGIEAQARLRLSSGQFEPGRLVFHPPGAVGPLGSAVACGILIGLDAEHLTHAIGIAASRAGAILANVGSMTKSLHCGQAAASGLESALLAAKGFTADPDALSGPRGYGHAFFGTGFEPEELLRPRERLHIVSPGPAFKLYPSQYGTHFVITAALDARAEMAEDARIRQVRIISPPMPYVDRPFPASGLAGKFSFQYAAAVALLDGGVSVESFTDERRFAPDVVELLPKVVIEPDPTREGRFDHMTLDIIVELEDGRRIASHCDGPPGIWGRPVEPRRLRAKAEDCLTTAIGRDRARRMIGLCADLDTLGGDDVRVMMNLLSG